MSHEHLQAEWSSVSSVFYPGTYCHSNDEILFVFQLVRSTNAVRFSSYCLMLFMHAMGNVNRS